MWLPRFLRLTVVILVVNLGAVLGQDDLGIAQGYVDLKTANLNAKLVGKSQVLASLKPAGSDFDFLPFDYLSRRARNGQYHWGDITFRYRQAGTSSAWVDGDSALARQPVTAYSNTSANLTPTLPSGPLNITRQWTDVDGDLALEFSIQNTGSSSIEIGSLGFPAEFNSIFTDRTATEMEALCSLSDPYIGMHAGYIRVTPTRGTGAALVVTALGDTPLEAYRNLDEDYYDDTAYESQTFEGFYEWQVLSKAWAEKEWAGRKPWNAASSKIVQPGETMQFGLRFSVAVDGVRGIDGTIQGTGTPVARGVPGYIVPQDLTAQLLLKADTTVSSIIVDPEDALVLESSKSDIYTVTPSKTAWGRVRVTIAYTDGKIQTVHYYITKPATEAVSDLGSFSTTEQWFTDKSDPFGRAPSVMTYDYEEKTIVTQDERAWVAGLSDEAGAGSFLAAAMKQSIRPDAQEVIKLESFIDGVLWKTIQTADYSVRKSIFFYDPSVVPGYAYNKTFDWTSWTSWNRASAYAVDRAYDYVHVAATYWAFYRVGRAYPDLLSSHTWDWYLNQSYRTVVRSMQSDVGYNRVGLMGETVFGELLQDLIRENLTSEADTLTKAMKSRAAQWNSEEIPFGSEMAWDSTGQEGVYYWTKYFGYADAALKTVNSVLGYMPTVPHWGWNGNARRYWDNIYGGKLRRIERQIHHYGSGLNALVLLSAFRSNPSDTYLIQTGYGGTSGPISSINQDGFAAASFHSWPDTLKWDGISGDYGPNFVGLALGSGTYVVQDNDLGLVAYGGSLTVDGTVARVETRDAVRRKVFVGPLGVLISVDAGIIQEVVYDTKDHGSLSITLAQLNNGPSAAAAVLWVETTSGSNSYKVRTSGIDQLRGGWRVPLGQKSATVQLQNVA
ncbi:hypothetical protein JX265_002215 [Neoarthrinium moseri]|uniref:Glycoside hydrolase family 43 protein n=1 Tax=Neoarthrinium moseri TaxID=1658444 RepID=A0A9P9WUM9_9PEZI|nr:hypothetical protein JX265_002215 [Neoarthrinium moseri]